MSALGNPVDGDKEPFLENWCSTCNLPEGWGKTALCAKLLGDSTLIGQFFTPGGSKSLRGQLGWDSLN